MNGLLVLLFASIVPAAQAAPGGTCAEYVALTAKAGEPAPFATVRVCVGPSEVKGVWWRLDVMGPGAESPMYAIEAMTDRLPFSLSKDSLVFHRYRLAIASAGEQLEYQDVHTGRPLLPPWTRFGDQFVPVAAEHSALQEGFPQTCKYLGHVLSLREVKPHAWQPMESAKVLKLDPELLVGTARQFKDKEGKRLPNAEKQDYTYTPFTEPDYAVMLKAGINQYCVTSQQERFVRAEPVFYLRRPEKNMPFQFPADLYRSNFLGTEMFLDEPAIIMVGDEQVNRKLQRFSDATALLHARIRASSNLARSLERTLGSRFQIGELTLENTDYPAWETLYYTAFYQMEAGLAGFAHEGRYRLDGFDKRIARWAGTERKHTVDEMLRYHYAFLRGGTAPFGKSWGTAIYGQADPAVNPRAVTLAYDMGARYIWFWTSDHEHHLPWNEQVELARTLKKHASDHPRESIRRTAKPHELAIAIPYGYFLSLDELGWIRDLRGQNAGPASAAYRRVMQRAHEAIDAALASGQDFDLTVDAGRPIEGYQRVIRITDAE